MKISLEQDKKKRTLFVQHEFKKDYYLMMMTNTELSKESRLFYQLKIAGISRISSITRIQNRCLLTARGRGVFSSFGMSRITLREHASKGLIPGLIKKSW